MLWLRNLGFSKLSCANNKGRATALLSALLFCNIAPASADWYSDRQDIMGTRISVELWSDDARLADESIALVMEEMRRIDRQLSPYIDSSELSRVNRLAAKEIVPISRELADLIKKSFYYSEISDGAFDISFASVGRFYDYREGEKPAEQELNAHLPEIDYRSIALDSQALTVRFLKPGLKIDLGGIAKGYAVDNGIAILQAQGIVAAVISAGGDSRILGDRGDRPWIMGIRHPRQEGEQAVNIPLSDTALSTSGDYERYFIDENGERIHHIINPSTGKSASEVQSVSILAPMAIDSDALSTTVFVMGVKHGLALVNRLPGIDAIIIDGEGKLHYSQDLLLSVPRDK